jgi:hypothetical protein
MFLSCVVSSSTLKMKQYFPPKHRLTSTELHGVISHKTELFNIRVGCECRIGDILETITWPTEEMEEQHEDKSYGRKFCGWEADGATSEECPTTGFAAGGVESSGVATSCNRLLQLE